MSDWIEVIAGEVLDWKFWFPVGAVLKFVDYILNDDICVNDECPCEDEDCAKISVDDEEIGCACCCNIWFTDTKAIQWTDTDARDWPTPSITLWFNLKQRVPFDPHTSGWGPHMIVHGYLILQNNKSS